MHLATAYFAIALFALLATASVSSYALGSSRGLFWDEVDREASPVYFWVSWSLWSATGLFVLAGGLWRAYLATTLSWDANIASLIALGWMQKAMLLAFPTLLLGGLAWRRIRIGKWRPYLAYLKRRYEQRKRLRALILDEDTGIEGVPLNEFLAVADPEWVEDIIAHLRTQSERSLKQAIQATSDP